MSPKQQQSLQQQTIPRSHTASQRKTKFITNYDLGAIRSAYISDKNFQRKRNLARIFLLAAVLVFLSGLVLWVYGYSTHGLSFASRWSQAAFWSAGILLAFWLLTYLSNKFRSTKVHQNGISLWTGEKPDLVYQWNDITGIFFNQEEWYIFGRSILRSHLHIRTHNNEKINLARYCSNESRPELATQVKAKVYKRLDPHFRKCLWQGHPLNFGTLEISPEQIIVHKKMVDWDEFLEMNIYNGRLLIRLKDGSNHSIPLIKIANFELLLPLAQLAKEIGIIQRKDLIKHT